MCKLSTIVSREHGAVSRHIRITTTNTVVETLCLVNIDFHLRVVRVSQLSLLEVLLHGFLLVRRLREVVGETAGAGEVCGITTQVSGHYALRILDCLVGVEHGASDGGHVGAVRGVLGVEDLSLGSQTTVDGSVVVEGGDAVVSRGEQDGMALQAEFHKFIALALGVGDWKIGFGLSIGGTDDGGGLVYTALKLTCFV